MWPKNRAYPAFFSYLFALHFGFGQLEHSITLRPVPSVQLLNSTSVSLTRLPHWHVLVFGAAAAAVVVIGVVVVVIGVVLWELLYTTTLQTISISRFHCGGKKYTVATLSQGIILKRIFRRLEYAPDNLITRTGARIHLKKIGLTLPHLLDSLPCSVFVFIQIAPTLVAVPVSFAVGGVFHAVGKLAQAAAQCSVTEGKLGV